MGASQHTGQRLHSLADAFSRSALSRCAVGLAAQPDLGAARDLEALREAYTPGAPRFRFQHLLLNVVDAPGARVKPPGVDELRWREALQVPNCCHNPGRMCSVLCF